MVPQQSGMTMKTIERKESRQITPCLAGDSWGGGGMKRYKVGKVVFLGGAEGTVKKIFLQVLRCSSLPLGGGRGKIFFFMCSLPLKNPLYPLCAAS